ncbi:MAG: hypothetical protein JRJ39_10280 [Deltaproteobacteria bacterium]|nr:hypothetical protein [Deltaproteobacteria bacterium]
MPVQEVGSDINKLTAVFSDMLLDWTDYFRNHQITPEFPFIYSFDFATPPDYDGFFKNWNSKSEERGMPMINYATGDEWAESVIKGQSQFAEIAGERPNVWLYIHGPSHQKAVKASREGSRLLTAAEKFATFDALQHGSFDKYPQKELETAWENAIYPDHGWGGKHGDLTDRAFRNAFEKGRDIAAEVVQTSMQNIASRINFSGTGIPIVVFNPLSWKRTDIVKFTLDVEGIDENRFKLVDNTGTEIPYQLINKHQIKGKRDEVITFLFVAEDVPSIGYKTYYLEKGNPTAWPRSSEAGSSICENQFYKVEFSEGGIKSLFDKELSVELLKTDKFLGAELFTMQSVGNGAGEFTDVQQPTMEGFEKLSQYKQAWSLVSEGPVRDVYQFTKEINHVQVEQRIVLYKMLKRIDVELELQGFDGERFREFRLAFPVNQATSEVAYEVPMGVVRVGKDEIKGAAGFSKPTQIYDTPCAEVRPREVQDWFSASDGNNGITISSDVAVFDWIDPTTDPAKNTILQPILLASRKSCHDSGNYFLQPGDHQYSFSIYSHKGDWKNSYRLGTQSNQPLMTVTVENSPEKGEKPEIMSLITIDGKNLILSTVKKCDDDNQVVVRCYDIEGVDTNGKIRFFKPFQSAEQTNMIEEDGKHISGEGNSLELKIGHHSIETFKFNLNN